MNINEFVDQRKNDWKRLEAIADRFKPGVTPKLNHEELWELGRLYTGAVSDLSLLKSSEVVAGQGNELVEYLNGLVIRVHSTIYRKHRRFEWRWVWDYLIDGFPKAFRAALAYNLLSTAVFVFFGIIGFVLGITEPGFIELVVPGNIIDTVEKGEVWFKGLYSVAPMATSALITNNVSVTFLIVAAGITFGIGTFYLLAFNGLLIGAVAAVCHQHGLSVELWSFVLPHGSLELSAIFIGGGAGLVIGHALLDPGQYRRTDYLSMRGPLVVRLAMGTVPLLIMAGIIEAFLSPSPLIPVWIKFAFAGLLFSALVIHLMISGRKSVSNEDTFHAL